MKCRSILCLAILLLPIFAFGSSKLFSYQCPRKGQVLFFANGMFNTYDDADKALDKLKSYTDGSFYDYQISYNENEVIVTQIFEVVFQKIAEGELFLWRYFSRLEGPEWFRELARATASTITASMYTIDKDLKKHVDAYKKYMSQNNELIVVAHSQGNFYANQALEFLALNDSHPSLGILAVATPARYVAGNGKYVTLESDGVITNIPGSLSPNVENTHAGTFDHEFIRHYLGGTNSREEILYRLHSISPGFNPRYAEPGYLDISLLKMKDWVFRLDKMRRDEKLSKAQCLATTLFLQVENWWGADCDERNIQAIERHGRQCFKEEWTRSGQYVSDCSLAGLEPPNNVVIVPHELTETDLQIAKQHPECIWTKNDLGPAFTENLLNEAFAWIKNPIE